MSETKTPRLAGARTGWPRIFDLNEKKEKRKEGEGRKVKVKEERVKEERKVLLCLFFIRAKAAFVRQSRAESREREQSSDREQRAVGAVEVNIAKRGFVMSRVASRIINRFEGFVIWNKSKVDGLNLS
jgi:hypothetical protein